MTENNGIAVIHFLKIELLIIQLIFYTSLMPKYLMNKLDFATHSSLLNNKLFVIWSSIFSLYKNTN